MTQVPPPSSCPSCNLPLEPAAYGGELVDQCQLCGGEYVEREALRRLLAITTTAAGFGGSGYVKPSPLSDPVRYRRCPSCGERMQRQNFRESSGVVVDVCAAHGVWFDRGELAKVLEFARSGALAEADRRIADRAEARRRTDAWGRDLVAVGPRHYIGGGLLGSVGVAVDEVVDDGSLGRKRDPED